MTDCDVAVVFEQNGAIQEQRGVGEAKRIAGEAETRKGGRGKARPREGVEAPAKHPLTATQPLDNPGILSEINLSSWSC